MSRVKDPLSHHHSHRSCADMSFRQSFSRFRKKTKYKVSNIGNRIKRQATCAGGEGFDHSSLSLQSEPANVARGEVGGSTGVGVGNDDSRPGDSLPVSRSITELEREPEGSGDYTARWERGQEGLHPHAYEWAARGAGRERVGQVDPPRSESGIGRRSPTPSILHGSESEST